MESSKTFGGFLKIYLKKNLMETLLHYPLDPILWVQAFKILSMGSEDLPVSRLNLKGDS